MYCNSSTVAVIVCISVDNVVVEYTYYNTYISVLINVCICIMATQLCCCVCDE